MEFKPPNNLSSQPPFLPAALGHARDKTPVGHATKANAADAKGSHVATRTTAQLAAILVTSRHVGRRVLANGLGDF